MMGELVRSGESAPRFATARRVAVGVAAQQSAKWTAQPRDKIKNVGDRAGDPKIDPGEQPVAL